MTKPDWDALRAEHGVQDAPYNQEQPPWQAKKAHSSLRLPSSDDPRFMGRLPIPPQDTSTSSTSSARTPQETT